jgi:hypothetical protein
MRGLGPGEEQGRDADAGEAVGRPVPALFDVSLSDDRGNAGYALGPVWCRPPCRDLIFREPGFGAHLNKNALAVARRDPLLDSIEGTGRVPQTQARLVEDEGSQRRQISGSAKGAVAPQEEPNSTTGCPVRAATASTTAATSLNSRSAE